MCTASQTPTASRKEGRIWVATLSLPPVSEIKPSVPTIASTTTSTKALTPLEVDPVLDILLPQAGSRTETRERARTLFLSPAPSDREAFERMGRELAGLERALAGSGSDSRGRTGEKG